MQYTRLLASIVREATARIFTHPPFPFFFFYDSRKTVKNQAISEKTGFLRIIFDTPQKMKEPIQIQQIVEQFQKQAEIMKVFLQLSGNIAYFQKPVQCVRGIRLLDGKALDMCALRVPAYCPPIGKYPKFLV